MAITSTQLTNTLNKIKQAYADLIICIKRKRERGKDPVDEMVKARYVSYAIKALEGNNDLTEDQLNKILGCLQQKLKYNDYSTTVINGLTLVVKDPTSESGGSCDCYVSVTYSEASNLRSTSDLKKGAMYFINDKDVYLHAISDDQFSMYGSHIRSVPDFQDTKSPGNFLGTWTSGLSPSVGNIVQWNQRHYKNKTGANGGSNPASDSTNWDLLALTDTSYVKEVHKIEYDFDNDRIQKTICPRGNEITHTQSHEDGIQAWGFDTMDYFRFGDDKVHSNIIHDGGLATIRNSFGDFYGNVIEQNELVSGSSSTTSITDTATSLIANNKFSGYVLNVDLAAGAKITGNDFQSTSFFRDCTLESNAIFQNNTLTADAEFRNKTIKSGVTFEENFISGKTTSTLDISFSMSGKRLEDQRSTFENLYDISDSIADFPTTNTMEITGDVTARYKSGDSIEVAGHGSNNGTYTLSTDSTEAGGVTTITITTTWTATSGGGTVTGQRVDLENQDLFGVISLVSGNLNISIKELQNLKTKFVTHLHASNGTGTTELVRVAKSSASDGQFVLTVASNITLSPKNAKIYDGDFIVVRRESTYIRELYRSVLT